MTLDDDDDDAVAMPQGVKLRDPNDVDGIREDIEGGVMKSMQRFVHGYEYGGTRLELSDMSYRDKPTFSLEEQREALMRDSTLARRLKGTVSLVDVATNKPLEVRKNVTLARVPYLTERGTMIHNGSEYAPISQSRLLPGAYTRRRNNGELETHFNTRPGTGSAMRMSLDPASGQFRLRVGSSNVHAYSVFKDLGASDEELERRWGPEILEANREGYDPRATDRVYAKAIPKWQRDATLTRAEKAAAVYEAFGRAQVAKTVLKDNLPNLFSREKAAAWRFAGAAIEKAAAMCRELAKSAGYNEFKPDLSPEDLRSELLSQEPEQDLPMLKAAGWQDYVPEEEDPEYADEGIAGFIKWATSFDPDLDPKDMLESYNSIYGRTGPRLASMKEWPEHWLNDKDPKGWMEWYENYHTGRRDAEHDAKQIRRWASFKAKHGTQFQVNPTPRRAFALINWAIDPLKLLPAGERADFQEEMDRYRRTEYVKWALNRFDFDEERMKNLLAKARKRGSKLTGCTHRSLMMAALDGHIHPEDLKP